MHLQVGVNQRHHFAGNFNGRINKLLKFLVTSLWTNKFSFDSLYLKGNLAFNISKQKL